MQFWIFVILRVFAKKSKETDFSAKSSREVHWILKYQKDIHEYSDGLQGKPGEPASLPIFAREIPVLHHVIVILPI